MQYLKVVLNFSDPDNFVADLLAAELGDLGFESFESSEEGLIAYVQETEFNSDSLVEMVSRFTFAENIPYTIETVESKNWNEEWEKHYFEPIIIDDMCIIHSSFHTDVPQLKYNIIINPQMAFGTGHHETTSLIISEILLNDFTDKRVLDMGCGTSILAILAAKRGANDLMAIDIDDWCVRNSHENIALNDVDGITVLQGDTSLLKGQIFNVIIANINRNILLKDMKHYANSLQAGGELYISGFYTEDIEILEKEAKQHKLGKVYSRDKNNWAMLKLKRS